MDSALGRVSTRSAHMQQKWYNKNHFV